MSLHDNAYAAFMLDYAAGSLPPAERLAADLHRALSMEGGRNARLMEALGGAMLEKLPSGALVGAGEPGQPDTRLTPTHLEPYLRRDLVGMKWRTSIWGVKTAPSDVPMTSFLRLDPGERAPSHGHGRRDVTVVLRGAYADDFGVYERGDLAFAEPGMRHAPRAVGGETCVCLVATEAGRPIRGFIGLFGLGAGNQKVLA
ncbi:MAG: cupin domain-containing protein [Hyphomonadaceae bacterium]